MNTVNRDHLLQQLRIGPIWTLREATQAGASPLAAVLSDGRRGEQVEQISASTAATPSFPSTQPVPHEALNEALNKAPQEPLKPREQAISGMAWAELESSVAGCRACGLCEKRAKTVFGVGDRLAKYLFVGEGPGYNENIQGEPFVGVAGQLLDNMLR